MTKKSAPKPESEANSSKNSEPGEPAANPRTEIQPVAPPDLQSTDTNGLDFQSGLENISGDNAVSSNEPTVLNHTRGISWDYNVEDNEFLSGLENIAGNNDASSNEPSVSRHRRGVSWDYNVEDNERPPGSPPRTGLVHANNKPPLPTTTRQGQLPPRPPRANQRESSNDTSGTATIDVEVSNNEKSIDSLKLDPDEALMKSLDERDPMVKGTGIGDNILGGVPMDQLQHNFGGNEHPNKIAEGQPGKETQARARLLSADRTTSTRQQPQQKGGKRRELTVEEALFGLTAALTAVQDDDRQHINSQDRPMRDRADTATSAADKLALTANLMFNRFNSNRENVDTSSDSEQSSPDTPGNQKPSKWGLVKDAVMAHKKSDDEQQPQDAPASAMEHDVEAGESTPNPLPDAASESSGEEHAASMTPEERRKHKGRFNGMNPFKSLPYSNKIKREWDQFNNFLKPRQNTAMTTFKYILIYLWTPAIAISALLFHFFDNPRTGVNEDLDSFGNETTAKSDSPVETLENKASVSWWIIFTCVREVFVLMMARGIEAIVVDFLALQTRAILNTFGPVVTLLFVQARGWAFLMTMWGILNFLLVTGDARFNHHWLYWQDWWGLFNEKNPSGDVTNTLWFRRVCTITSLLGVAIAGKRVAVGVYQGRQTFANYSVSLAQVMQKMLQVSQVAILSHKIEQKYLSRLEYGGISYRSSSDRAWSDENLLSLIASAQVEEPGDDASCMDMTLKSTNSRDEMENVIDTTDVDPFTGGLGETQRTRLEELLGRWEEPGRSPTQSESISIGAVLQFRRALASMDTSFPFSGAFGVADTRENCVASAQAVYDRLLLKNRTVNGRLHFDVIATLALDKRGELNQNEATELIRTFRPERDGTISMVDFVRSVDAVYRELRMLRATVAASSKIDKALESIYNMIFYVVAFCIILSVTGFDPLALFLSLSSIILAFAFMIGSASAKYFEGLLFILVQRPYGIGDRINVSNAQTASSGSGAQGWIVDDVTLFTTTIYLAGTNERATISNGTLASSRIINCARSPKAVICLNIKFGIDAPYKRTEIFKTAVESFVKARPREWLSLIAIRATTFEADLGYVEYCVALQHREAWQNIGPILDSKSVIMRFMLELSKRLDLRFKAPSLPIELSSDLASAPRVPPTNSEERELEDNQIPTSSQRSNTATIDNDVQEVLSMFSVKKNKILVVDMLGAE